MVANRITKSDCYVLRLYVVGNTSRSQAAISTLTQLCNTCTLDAYDLEIIDVLKQPDLAEHDKILATPTVVKRFPLPQRKIIGDLSDLETVKRELDIATSE